MSCQFEMRKHLLTRPLLSDNIGERYDFNLTIKGLMVFRQRDEGDLGQDSYLRMELGGKR